MSGSLFVLQRAQSTEQQSTEQLPSPPSPPVDGVHFLSLSPASLAILLASIATTSSRAGRCPDPTRSGIDGILIPTRHIRMGAWEHGSMGIKNEGEGEGVKIFTVMRPRCSSQFEPAT
jgi:hypothetical protein